MYVYFSYFSIGSYVYDEWSGWVLLVLCF